ncbi:MAG: BCD family MFS transporter [Rubrivivax sp.]|nr:BCD family MFS transporter [Rubrivivax sp.]
MSASLGLSWAGIARLGLVQAMLGAVVVLTTSTLNRVMVVELALPALLPGLLVAWHHAVQLTRPHMGFGADVARRRTPWIVGGMIILALGGWLGAVATATLATQAGLGLALAVLAFTLVGLGVSAAGTSLLTLLAKSVAPERRAAAAATVWVMMIIGFAVTAGVAGKLLDPFSAGRLMMVSGGVSVIAVLVTLLALLGLERRAVLAHEIDARRATEEPMTASRFRAALAEVWSEPEARRFTIFVFVSMIAYSAQDLILEPFAGVMFGYSPGESTQLSGVQHGGTLAGMLLASLAGRRLGGFSFGSLRAWIVWGCLASALCLAGLVVAGLGAAPNWPLRANVFAMGVANGVFSIAAIGSMMALAGQGRGQREGTRMGLWGAAQAIGFAAGGVAGTALNDLARWLLGTPGPAYASVFAIEALMFVAAALLARHLALGGRPAAKTSGPCGAASPTPLTLARENHT